MRMAESTIEGEDVLLPKVMADGIPPTKHTSEISSNNPLKRKAEDAGYNESKFNNTDPRRRTGVAPIKDEYLLEAENNGNAEEVKVVQKPADDDAAEAFHHQDRQSGSHNAKTKRRDRNQGQNKARKFGSSRDEVGLCSTRVQKSEFLPDPCQYGEKCRFEHDLRRYLREHKRQDLDTFSGLCPVFEVKGSCPAGWKCRFVGSHSEEAIHEDGRKELILKEDPRRSRGSNAVPDAEELGNGVANVVSAYDRIQLTKKKFSTPKSDLYLNWLETSTHRPEDQGKRQNIRKEAQEQSEQTNLRNSSSPEPLGDQEKTNGHDQADLKATFVEPPLRPSEKRRLYFDEQTPILAPLTTQGNLPFRRLCTSLGATFTYSEMAMSLPLIQGQKSEWALIKAHESEIQPPTFSTKGVPNIVYNYDQNKDLRFGAQIAANKPWLATKATEVLTTLLPQGLRCVDLNVGCPIDLVYREGAGSALMDSPHKLEKMLRAMNTVSGETPVTVKIRMGTKDKVPTAQKLVDRLVLGGNEYNRGDPCGVAAITLHGRSRQQRYTRSADWEYIAETASLIQNLNKKADIITDTIYEPEERDLPNGQEKSKSKSKVFFIGNGDVYSHEHYYNHIRETKIDGAMIARGALIKPWIFEEISSNQYLDKSANERLQYIENFVRYGLEAWGSDEIGVGQTRRFLLEWLSFSCRYVPIGLLEYLPPNIQDRPPRFRGRNELETLLSSDNYLDWIKISEMFLGPAHKDFRFEPKHQSNSYEIQAEG